MTETGALDPRLHQAASSLDTLAAVAQVNRTLADTVGSSRPSDAEALARLLAHLSGRGLRQ